MATDLETLVEFGFSRERAELALRHGESLQNALEWLEMNESRSMKELLAPAEASEDTPAVDTSPLEAGKEVKSMVCNDCGKNLRMNAFRAHHENTGHENFSESTDEIAPLTEEQKEAKLEELKKRRDERKALQAIMEKKQQMENEKIRLKATRQAQDAKEKLAQEQRIKDAAKKRQEKIEDIAAKKRVDAKIAADREARRLKAEALKAQREGRLAPAGSTIVAAMDVLATKSSTSRPTATDARLRLQTHRGILTKTLPAETTLFELSQQIESELGGPITSFTTTYPKKTFSGSIDFGKTLKEAGLVPSAVLLVG